MARVSVSQSVTANSVFFLWPVIFGGYSRPVTVYSSLSVFWSVESSGTVFYRLSERSRGWDCLCGCLLAGDLCWRNVQWTWAVLLFWWDSSSLGDIQRCHPGMEPAVGHASKNISLAAYRPYLKDFPLLYRMEYYPVIRRTFVGINDDWLTQLWLQSLSLP